MQQYGLIFLIGGWDLEMEEIKKLLESNDIPFLDAKLNWANAHWNEYLKGPLQAQVESSIDSGLKVIGIELQGNPPNKESFGIIDHHNERQHLPSSIEQIAELLAIELNRWQKLVAANDSGYIPAMKKFGASESEVDEIRKADRKLQGVTEQDEKDALVSISDQLNKYGDLTVVCSVGEKFSPIPDLLFGKQDRLLIYNSSNLVYYGKDKNKVSKRFQDLIENDKAYEGGGDSGYFGLKKERFLAQEIQEIKEIILTKILNLLHSHHIFIFPFKWQHAETEEEDSLLKRLDLKKLRDQKLTARWKRKEYDLDSNERYNEYNYFYRHVAAILYDHGKELQDGVNQGNQNLLNHFEYELPKEENWHYCIKLKNEKEEPYTYKLKIDSILLNVYSTGTAVLSFHLRNFYHPDPEDVLLINLFGRRIFPPFFQLDHESVFTGNPSALPKEKGLDDTKSSELADKIWIGNPDLAPKETYLYEDFNKYLDPAFYKSGPFSLPNIISGLFGEKNWAIYKTPMGTVGQPLEGVIVRPILDDRMFVLTWYANESLINTLQRRNKNDLDLDSKTTRDCEDWWYRFVFVDGSSTTCQDDDMKSRLIKATSYTRWIGYGTIFGISRYSLVMLTSPKPPTFLIRHLQTMYYKMAELCLVQRATVLNYADEVTHVSHLLLEEHKEEITLEKIAVLYRQYLVFINKIFFKEITAQEQGIEMYEMLHKQMRLQEDVIALDKQIEELHRYADIEVRKISNIKEDKNNQLLTKLTIIGAIFLPLSLVGSILQWTAFGEDFHFYLNNVSSFTFPRVGALLLLSIPLILSIDLISKFKFAANRKESRTKRLTYYGIAFIMGIAFAFSHFFTK